jgi:hypothetical protein
MSRPFIVSDSYEDLHFQAQQYLESSQYEQAEAIYERLYNRLNKLSETAFKRRPSLKELLMICADELASLLSRRGEFDRAIALNQRMLEIVPPERYVELRHAIARLKIDKGDVKVGLDELRALAVISSGQDWIWLSLGQALLGQKEYEEAEASFKRVGEQEGFDLRDRLIAYSLLQKTYQEQGHYDQAEKAWLAALDLLDPQDQTFLPLYAMYLDAGKLDRAEYWLNKEKHPCFLGLYRGLIAQAKGDTETAIKHWENVAAKDPWQHDTEHSAWAEALLRAGLDPYDVIEVMEQRIEDDNLTMRESFLLAIADILIGELEVAHLGLEEILDKHQYNSHSNAALLPVEDWQLLSKLVADAETLEEFKQYFEVEEVPSQETGDLVEQT